MSGVEAWAYLRREGDVYDKAAIQASTQPAEFYASPAYEAYLAAKSDETQTDRKHLDEPERIDWSGSPLKGLAAGLSAVVDNFFSRRFVNENLIRYGNLWLRFGRKLKGTYPDVGKWNHAWSDAKLVLDWTAKASRGGAGKTLVVGDPGSQLLRFFKKSKDVDCMDEAEFSTLLKLDGGEYSHILVQVNRVDVRRTQLAIERALSLTNSDAEIAISISHPNYETDAANFTYELAQYVDDILPNGWLELEITALFTGGKIKRRLRLLESGFSAKTLPKSVWQIPTAVFAVLGLPAIAVLTALNNLSLRNPSKACPEFCSSALLVLCSRRGQ